MTQLLFTVRTQGKALSTKKIYQNTLGMIVVMQWIENGFSKFVCRTTLLMFLNGEKYHINPLYPNTEMAKHDGMLYSYLTCMNAQNASQSLPQ